MALLPLQPKECCEKCGGLEIELKYQFKKQTGFAYFDEDELSKLPTENEWLKLTCKRCGYHYNRAPIKE